MFALELQVCALVSFELELDVQSSMTNLSFTDVRKRENTWQRMHEGEELRESYLCSLAHWETTWFLMARKSARKLLGQMRSLNGKLPGLQMAKARSGWSTILEFLFYLDGSDQVGSQTEFRWRAEGWWRSRQWFILRRDSGVIMADGSSTMLKRNVSLAVV